MPRKQKEAIRSRADLEAIKAGKDLETLPIYLCPVCGNVEIGVLPEKCPICGVPKEKFVEVK